MLVHTRGISLLEAVIYVAILAMIFVVVINTVIAVSNSFGKARLTRNVTSHGSAALERMLREVRLADSVNDSLSILGSHPGVLVLNTVISASDDTPTSRTFSLDAGTLTLQEEESTPVPMTRGVAVSNLVFYKITASTTSEAVRIEMTVEDSAGTMSVSKDFSATAVLRRSY